MNQVWCNGRWQAADECGVPFGDRGLLHGLGLFETLLAVDGRPVFVERHLARLQQGLERLRWSLGDHDLRSLMSELLTRQGLDGGRARIRLAMTGGAGRLDELEPSGGHCLWLMAAELGELPAALRVDLSRWRRNQHSPLAGLKCASYAENLLALDEARRAGLDEVLLLNAAGDLCEAAMANLFVVRDGKLFTPDLSSGCLPGVTRGVVLELAASLDIEASECRLSPAILAQADELFLTSATRGLMPVAHCEGRRLGESVITRKLAQAWAAAVERQAD